jgi:hypothetical protein
MYSANIADMGNCAGDAEFFVGMGYAIPEMLRITIPGRLCIVHAKDRTVYGTRNDGYAYKEPFSDNCVRAMMQGGWLYQGRITIATDPVRENNQTHSLGHGELLKDASKFGVGSPEYLLLFRKPHTQTAKGGTKSDAPVLLGPDYSLARWQIDANAVWKTYRPRRPEPWNDPRYDYIAHVAAMDERDRRGELSRANGEPIQTDDPAVWWDIRRARCLNNALAKDNGDEKHICPLPEDIVRRVIDRWSMRGDIVFDPFAGIGSVPVFALEAGRIGWGVELKRSYFDVGCQFLTAASARATQATLDLDIAA